MSVLRKRWRLGLLLLACGGMLVVVVRTAVAGPNTRPREVDRIAADRVEPVPGPGTDLRVERPEGDWIGGMAVVEPARPEHRLAPSVGGRVAAIRVDEGDVVEAGRVLVELESGPEVAALAAAEAEVAEAEVEVSRTRSGVRREEVEALTREAEAARVRAELSADVFERLQRASAGGGVTTDELDRARRQAEEDRLTAEVAAARRQAGQRGRPLDVRLAEARLQAARARRDQAQANLERLRIVAPTAGEVLEVHYRVGEYVQPGGEEPVVILGDTSTLRARVDVDERDIARLAVGARALLVVDALPAERFEGTVVTVGRRMGRKNIRTDEPTERIDTKILEVVVDLGEQERLVVGQRAMAYLAPADGERPVEVAATSEE